MPGWRRKWQPTPVFLPGEFHGQRSLAGYSPQGHKESDTTEATWHSTYRGYPGVASGKEVKWSEVKSLNSVWLFATLWTVACQAPLSMGFSRQECWSGLPCPPPGDLADPEIEPRSLMFPALAGGFLTSSAIWEAPVFWILAQYCPSPLFLMSADEQKFLILTKNSLVILFFCA